jgi:hypothetical protein
VYIQFILTVVLSIEESVFIIAQRISERTVLEWLDGGENRWCVEFTGDVFFQKTLKIQAGIWTNMGADSIVLRWISNKLIVWMCEAVPWSRWLAVSFSRRRTGFDTRPVHVGSVTIELTLLPVHVSTTTSVLSRTYFVPYTVCNHSYWKLGQITRFIF